MRGCAHDTTDASDLSRRGNLPEAALGPMDRRKHVLEIKSH